MRRDQIPEPLDYRTPPPAPQGPGQFINTLRRMVLISYWIFAGVMTLYALIAIILRENPLSSIHSDLLD